MQITGQKTQLLAGFHGGARQDDAVHLLRTERRHSHGDRKVRFTGARRADADGDGVIANIVAIILLSHRFGLYGLAFRRDTDAAVRKRRHLCFAVLHDHVDAVADVLVV